MSIAQTSLGSIHSPIVVTTDSGYHVNKRLKVDSSDSKGIACIPLKKPENLCERIKYSIQKFVLLPKYINTEVEASYNDNSRQMKVAIRVKSVSKELGISKADIRMLGRERLGEVLQVVHKGTLADEEVHEFLGAIKGERLNTKSLMWLFTENALQRQTEVDTVHETLFLRGSEISGERIRLATGSFGTVYKVKELSLNSFRISTVAEKVSNYDPKKPNFSKRALKDLENEADKLFTIAKIAKEQGKEEVLEGIQEVPLKRITYEGEQGVLTCKLYLEGSINTKINDLSTSQIIKGITPLLKALAFTQSVHLVNVDIKPGNIFVDTNIHGQIIFKLADFGGSRWQHELYDSKLGEIMTHTPGTTPHPYWEPMDLFDEESMHKIGSFQMGVTLFHILTKGQYPYSHSNSYQNTMDLFNEKALVGHLPEIVDFIKTMVHTLPNYRPIGDQIRIKWEQIISKYGGIERLAKRAQRAKGLG